MKVQNRLIHACFLLHNFIRREMENDPIEQLIDSLESEEPVQNQGEDEVYVDAVDSTLEWNLKRDELASSMWQS